MRDPETRYIVFALAIVILGILSLSVPGHAQQFGPITSALTDANQEARSSIVPAVAAILGVVVLIGVGSAVVRAVTRAGS